MSAKTQIEKSEHCSGSFFLSFFQSLLATLIDFNSLEGKKNLNCFPHLVNLIFSTIIY